VTSEEKRTRIKELSEAAKTVFGMFRDGGQFAPGRVSEVMPRSINKTNEALGYCAMITDGLTGLMKDLAYAAYVEEELR